MLTHLKVENLAVVDKVELSFSPHLNILTGETGAGKSILIDAIQLLLSKNVPTSIIRDGEDKLVVETLFTRGNEEFVLRREVKEEGTFAYLDGKMVSFKQLKKIAAMFLNIYGHSDHDFLLNASNHRAFLDEYAANHDIQQQLSAIYRQLKKEIKELEELKQKTNQVGERIDFLNFQINEIENLKMEKEDENDLQQRLKILASSEEIISRANTVIEDFYQSDHSVYNLIAKNISHIDYLKSLMKAFAPFQKEIDHFYSLIPEISTFLGKMVESLEYNEDELNDIEAKFQHLNRLKAKHQLTLEDLLKKCETLKQERDTLMNLDFHLAEKQKEIETILTQYRKIHEQLRRKRKEVARKLSHLIEEELVYLEMKHAIFQVNIEEIDPTVDNISETGTDSIEFFFTSNPGQEPGPLAEVASGGELSRLMLVLKSIIKQELDATFIFDEIDSGIGGKTAQFVGEKLRKIAEDNQVICISHLPQIAAYADSHFLISKVFRDNQTFSTAKELDECEQVDEIARLMAGSSVNASTIKAAQTLLKRSQR